MAVVMKRVFAFVLMLACSSQAFSARIYEYDVPGAMTIAFSGNSYKKYLNLIDGADSADTINIGEEFKKSLKIFGTYRDETGQEHLFSGRGRITGDLKDHLEPGKRISSLSITLKEGNVGGVVKFRLLIPDTRQSENEIFWSLLMEQLGYPVPFRRMVNVNLMGENHGFIFEEKPEKEFLESNGFREGPILEFDERQLWSNFLLTRSWGRWLDQLKIKNSDFLKNKVAYEIAYRSLDPKFARNRFFDLYDSVNKEYAPHGVTAHNRKYLYDVIYNDYLPIYFDGDVFEGKENLCSGSSADQNSSSNTPKTDSAIKVLEAKFRDRTLNARFSDTYRCVAAAVLEHFAFVEIKFKEVRPLQSVELGLDDDLSTAILRHKGLRFRPPLFRYNPRNRTGEECFYIHPESSAYLDRFPDLLSAYQSSGTRKSKEEWGESHYRNFGHRERREFFSTTADAFLFEHYVERYPDLLAAYDAVSGQLEKDSWGRNHFWSVGFKTGRNIYGPGDEESSIEAIETLIEQAEPESFWGNCQPLSEKKLKKVFSGEERPLMFGRVPYYGFLNVAYSPEVAEVFREINVLDSDATIEIPSGITYIKLSAQNAKIDVRLLADDAYLVLHNSSVVDSSINVLGTKSRTQRLEVRYNTKLLTSCLTLIDSVVRQSTFVSSSCNREDAVNFIRVDGISVRLDIRDAASDGFDADFSHVQFDSVRIENSGNDCIDLSAGVYNLRDIDLHQCGDKGVSAGERSLVSLRNVSIADANIGIASKDLSRVSLSGMVSIKDAETCLTAYQKKQEFGPAFISSDKPIYKCDFKSPGHGFFETNESCEFSDRTYFFDVCVIQNKLHVRLNKDLPRDHTLFLEVRRANMEWVGVEINRRETLFDTCIKRRQCVTNLPGAEESAVYRMGLYDRTLGVRVDVREISGLSIQ